MKNILIFVFFSASLVSCGISEDPERGVSKITDGQQEVPTAKIVLQSGSTDPFGSGSSKNVPENR